MQINTFLQKEVLHISISETLAAWMFKLELLKQNNKDPTYKIRL